jgi:TldD protein
MTTSLLAKVEARLLEPNDLTEREIAVMLGSLMSSRNDFADIYFQIKRSESWMLEEGIVKAGSFSLEQGVGVRAVSGEQTALAFSDDISLTSIRQAAETVRAVGGSGRGSIRLPAKPQPSKVRDFYSNSDPLSSLDAEGKIALLRRVDETMRARDPRVIYVAARLIASHEHILVARYDGCIAADIRPLVRLNVAVVVEQNGRREAGVRGSGGRFDYSAFDDLLVENHVDRALDAALRKLEAVPAPAGTMTAVCGPGWPGVLLHEAVGHGLEGDFNRIGTSAFSGRIGERVAAPGVTVIDNGTLADRRGSLNVDDEGNPTQSTTLIENGILISYMHDSLSARLMDMPLTGNARRQSYAHPPMPRMTNTFMANGVYDPEEIIASVKSGIYVVNFAGGQVDITNGKFVFDATEAYLIEGGRIGPPIKGATLIGHGPESLKHVTMVGNDLALDPGIAVCDKNGQSLPVGVGQPTVRIDEITVGGTTSVQ